MCREHQATQLERAGTGEDVTDRLLMYIPEHEIAAAIDDAADDLAVGMHAHVLERVATTKSLHLAQSARRHPPVGIQS